MLSALLTLVLSSLAHAGIEPTSGRYVDTVEDIRVKVLGGAVVWDRTYRDREWHFARRWSKLDFELDAGTGAVRRIMRASDEYERVDSAGTLFRFGPTMIIRKTDTGYTWSDRQGNSIVYDDDGRPTSFANRSGVSVKLAWSGNNLTGIFDHLDRQVLWIDYQGELPVLVHDGDNRQVSYSYIEGKLTAVTDLRGQLWQYGYDGSGNLTTKTDPLDRVTTIGYDNSGRANRMIWPDQTQTTYQFDYLSATKEYYLRTTEPGGKITEAWYQRDGDIKRRDVNGVTLLTVVEEGRKDIHIDFAGRRTTYEYDEFRNLTKTIYPDGTVMVSDRETLFSNVTREVDARGFITTYAYDSQGRRTRVVEAQGTDDERITEYGYDPHGNVNLVRQVGDANTQEAVTRYEYDDLGNLTKVIDAELGETTMTHDIMGNVLTRTDARNKVWIYSYDDAGNLLSETDPLTHTTSYHYDAAGNRDQVAYADTTTTTFVYDDRDRLIRRIDHLGGEYRYTYDDAGNRTAEIDESEQRTDYIFDSFHRLATITDGIGNETQFVYPDPTAENLTAGDFYQPVEIRYPTFSRTMKYDLRGRVFEQTDIYDDGEGVIRTQTTKTEYDIAGNRIASVDAKDRTTHFEYDALNRLKAATDALDNTTGYTYDDRGNLLALTDANHNTHRFTYDRLGRTLSESRPMGETHRYGYDPAGNLVEKIDAKGQKAEYLCDDAGRRTEINYYPDETTTTPAKTVSFSYNNRNSLTGYDDGTTQGAYVYDELQRKLDEQVTYPVLETSEPEDTFVLDYQYTYAANGQKASYTAIDDTTFDYSYNGIGELQSITIPGEGVIAFSEFNWNRPTQTTYPGGTVRTVGYDGLMRMNTIHTVNQAGEVLMDYDYQYDEVGNVLGRDTEHGRYDYGYDDIDRLISANYPTLEDETFSYDPLGNRTEHSRTGTTPWQYNDNNELLDSVNNKWSYDENGSTVEKADAAGSTEHQYVYNLENRMSEVRDGQGELIAQYYYGPFGRRLLKRVYEAGEPTTTYFAYTDEGYAGEVKGYDGGPLLYHFWPDGVWSASPIFRVLEGELSYYQVDQLGTAQLLVNSAGGIASNRRAEAFGWDATDAVGGSSLGFPGQLRDQETSNVYNWYRFYASEVGRYLSSDPLGVAAGSNTFQYALQNPITNADINGLTTKLDLGLAYHYATGNGEFIDIVGYCDLYEANQIVGTYIDIHWAWARNETRSLAGTLAPGESTRRERKDRTENKILRPWSFGWGFDNTWTDCTITGIDCRCVEANCVTHSYRYDRFVSPYNADRWGGGDQEDPLANLGGTPFEFRIWCSREFSFRECK